MFLRESWDGAAVFVEPADDAALTRALEQLASDAELRARLAAAARARAERFGVGSTARSYVNLYCELASNVRAAAS